ncbi:hypothetical protein RvY_01486 [Ramazzottius varieornatus]|uniref:Uncharacterized protein n=1 Tax=Ramazzottius varieornatus TaxID=947166 RepID=A0A1D1UNL1_RAMVA|nr:hypothetical protein RvY_01486 [Ramazzottius varieornatus]
MYGAAKRHEDLRSEAARQNMIVVDFPFLGKCQPASNTAMLPSGRSTFGQRRPRTQRNFEAVGLTDSENRY